MIHQFAQHLQVFHGFWLLNHFRHLSNDVENQLEERKTTHSPRSLITSSVCRSLRFARCFARTSSLVTNSTVTSWSYTVSVITTDKQKYKSEIDRSSKSSSDHFIEIWRFWLFFSLFLLSSWRDPEVTVDQEATEAAVAVSKKNKRDGFQEVCFFRIRCSRRRLRSSRRWLQRRRWLR